MWNEHIFDYYDKYGNVVFDCKHFILNFLFGPFNDI